MVRVPTCTHTSRTWSQIKFCSHSNWLEPQIQGWETLHQYQHHPHPKKNRQNWSRKYQVLVRWGHGEGSYPYPHFKDMVMDGFYSGWRKNLSKYLLYINSFLLLLLFLFALMISIIFFFFILQLVFFQKFYSSPLVTLVTLYL